MSGRPTKTVRCAIYTRKSTEHGLELEFNSLDAQREACEAYVKSQAPEGWKVVPTIYDDPAYSGGNLERPALQLLLEDIRKGRIDVIVVYKIDRLTRSLADFAKLVEVFDANSVSFVAITQQFNTTTSMGRLTLNILLSFAQFERELSSERVRDKIAASRRKGKWTGGSVPMGYDIKDKKLVANPAQAKTVQSIFRRYLDLGTIALLKQDLRVRKIHSKSRLVKGRPSGGIPFTYGPLAHLLRNRIYLGEIGHGGKWFAGEHQRIVDSSMFEKVQQQLDSHRVTRKRDRMMSGALLMGRLFDDAGNRMSPTFSVKKGVRYRFYVSTALLGKESGQVGSIGRVSAPEIEDVVVEAVRAHLRQRGDDRSGPVAHVENRSLIQNLLARITVSRNQLRIEFSHPNSAGGGYEVSAASSKSKPNDICLPWQPSVGKSRIELDEQATVPSAEPDPVLVQAIARAHAWLQQLSDGSRSSINQLAAANGIHPKVLRGAIRLAFLPPDVSSMVLKGEQPRSLKLAGLQDLARLSWPQTSHVFESLKKDVS